MARGERQRLFTRQVVVRLEPDTADWLERDAAEYGRTPAQSMRFYLNAARDAHALPEVRMRISDEQRERLEERSATLAGRPRGSGLSPDEVRERYAADLRVQVWKAAKSE